MPSGKQIQANRTNAKLGGVKTEKGKAVSKFNARKHGILSDAVTEYEQCNYQMLHKALIDDFPPKNTLEELVIERITVAYIKLLRASKAEAEHIKSAMGHKDELEFMTLNSNDYKAEVSVNYFESLATLYSRYETAAENRFYKAVNKLLELRATRQ